MRISNVSTLRTVKHQSQINWSRELTFSKRQYSYIRENIPGERGVYCVYAKDYRFAYSIEGRQNQKWSRLIYVGSGRIDRRLADHLRYARNDVLGEFTDSYELGYRFALIDDSHPDIDYPRAVEAGMLLLFKKTFGQLPPANRRGEGFQELNCKLFILNQSSNFNAFSQR